MFANRKRANRSRDALLYVGVTGRTDACNVWFVTRSALLRAGFRINFKGFSGAGEH
jgi:hypothetical protein